MKATTLRAHGLTAEQFTRLLHRAEAACELCRTTERRLQIDHDHATGFVRGLLCARCNARMRRVDAGEQAASDDVLAYLDTARAEVLGRHTYTPQRTLRIPDDVYDSAAARAEAEGTTLVTVLTTYLRRYGRQRRVPR